MIATLKALLPFLFVVGILPSTFCEFPALETSFDTVVVYLISDDCTRVTLDLIDGDQTSHYINASFIKVNNDNYSLVQLYEVVAKCVMRALLCFRDIVMT